MRKLDTGQLLQLASVLVTSSHGEAVLCVNSIIVLYIGPIFSRLGIDPT